MTMDTEERAQRLAFLDFTQQDAERLRELHPFAERHVTEIVDAFYEYLLQFEATRVLLADDAIIQHLKHTQREYFLSLTSGEYGAAYFEGRLRVGDAHQRMNLAPQWYLGTYCLYIRLLLPRLVAEFGSVPERLTAYLSSLTKVMFLDLGLAIDAYIVGGYMNRTLGAQYCEMADRARAALAALDVQERAKQTLVDMMVHDIRNPVSGILMTARVILRHHAEISDKQASRVRRIERSAADGLRMIQNMLDLSQLDAGRLVITLEDFSVEEALRESVEDARSDAEGAQVSVAIDVAETPLLVRADRTLTRRILQNLVVRAIRLSHAKDVRLSAVSQVDTVLVGVADRGSGIAPADQQLLFERFRLFDRRTAAHPDTGLGLPFSKLAVERIGGTMWTDSRDGPGTTVYFTLPKSHVSS